MFSIVKNVISVSSVLSQFTKTFKNTENSPKTFKNCQNSQKLSNIDKSCQKLSKIVKFVKNCQKLSKIVKIVKNCLKLSKIVKMLVRSCFLITVIKCLKGHWSLGLLFNVKNKSGSLTDSVSDKVTYWAIRWQLKISLSEELGSLKYSLTSVEKLVDKAVEIR